MDAEELDGIIRDAFSEEGKQDYHATAVKLMKMPEDNLLLFIAFVLENRDKWRSAHERLSGELEKQSWKLGLK